MQPLIHHLANGVRVVFDPLPGLASTALGVWVDAGARHEPAELAGAAHFLEHMAFKGTGGRDARAFAEAVEALGANMNAGAGYERTTYYARTLGENAVPTLDLVSAAVLVPDLPPAEIARERDVILQEMGEARDTPDDHVFTLAQTVAFRGHALARPILGDPLSLEGIDAPALDRLRQQFLRPERIIVGLSGAFDDKAALSLIEQRFGALKAEADAAPEGAIAAPVAQAGFLSEIRKLEQTHLVFSAPGPSQLDPLFHASRVFAEIFGGGMSSRLFQEIREKRGLAYTIDSYNETWSDIGRIGIYCATAPARAGEAADAIAEILLDLAEHGPRPDELARARTMLKAQILMGAEQPLGRLEWMAAQIFARGTVMRLSEIAARVDAVSAADVREIAARAAAGPIAAAAIGPKTGVNGAARFAKRMGMPH